MYIISNEVILKYIFMKQNVINKSKNRFYLNIPPFSNGFSWIEHCSTPWYSMPLQYILYIKNTNIHAKGNAVPRGGTMSCKTFNFFYSIWRNSWPFDLVFHWSEQQNLSKDAIPERLWNNRSNSPNIFSFGKNLFFRF